MNPGLKFALELGPVLIFVALTNFYDIHTAIYVFIVLAPLAMFITWKLDGAITTVQWVGTLFIVATGLITIFTGDSRFFKMKPTLASGLIGLALLYAYFSGKLWLKKVLGSQLVMPDEVWRTLTLRWGLFFIAMAVANEIAWRSLSDANWAYFKLALIPASLIFAATQAPLMMKYLKTDEQQD